MQEVLDLDGIDIFTAGDDDVFFAVDEVVETVLVLHSHVAGVEPAVVIEHFFGGFRVVVVADHDARAFDCEFADLTLFDGIAVFVDYAALPFVAGDSDRADLVDILDTEVDAAGSKRLGQAVVGVVLVIWEVFHPVLDH